MSRTEARARPHYIEKLTPAEEARFPEWRDRWIANAMSTKAMDDVDRTATRAAIAGLYEAAGKKPPPAHRIIFVPSPMVTRFAGGFAAAIWHLRKNAASAATSDATSAATRDATRDATLAATYDATLAATRAATRDATWAATWAATSDATSDATSAAADAATLAATYDATRAATRDATRDATSDATLAATYDATWAATSAATRAATSAVAADLSDDAWYRTDLAGLLSVAKEFGGSDWKFLVACAEHAYSMTNGGNQWSGWCAFISFFRNVCGLAIDYSKWEHYEKAAIHSGPRIMHEEFCIVSDRPEVLTVDDRNRPHNATGPFCRWRDGTELFSWHGTMIPAWVIRSPEKLSVASIEAEANQEVKRVMIEQFGPAKYMRDSGAKLLHSDECGELYEKNRGDGLPKLIMAKVLNSTPEPDGSRNEYWLRVHPELRPLLGTGANGAATFGEPQAMTCRNAVASTFGLRGEEYHPSLET